MNELLTQYPQEIAAILAKYPAGNKRSAVMPLLSLAQGRQNYITKQFEELGANIIIVMPGKLLSEDGGFAGAHGAPNFAGSKLTLDLARGIQRLGLPIEKSAGVIETAVFGLPVLVVSSLIMKIGVRRFCNCA